MFLPVWWWCQLLRIPRKTSSIQLGKREGKQELGSLVEHPLHVRQAGRDGDTKVEEIGYKPKDTSYCQAIVVGYREKLSQHRKCWR